jgi:hypothetical protein
MSNSIVDLSKDGIDMSKHCLIISDRHAILSKLYVNRPKHRFIM